MKIKSFYGDVLKKVGFFNSKFSEKEIEDLIERIEEEPVIMVSWAGVCRKCRKITIIETEENTCKYEALHDLMLMHNRICSDCK